MIVTIEDWRSKRLYTLERAKDSAWLSLSNVRKSDWLQAENF
jgi:hypothetical protein